MNPKHGAHATKGSAASSAASPAARLEQHGHAHLTVNGTGSARGLTRAERAAVHRDPLARLDGRKGSAPR